MSRRVFNLEELHEFPEHISMVEVLIGHVVSEFNLILNAIELSHILLHKMQLRFKLLSIFLKPCKLFLIECFLVDLLLMEGNLIKNVVSGLLLALACVLPLLQFRIEVPQLPLL